MARYKTVSIVVVLFVLFQVRAASGEEVYTDRIAAVVNGDVILESEVKKNAQPFIRKFMSLPLGIVPPGKTPTEKEVLDELVVIRLLEQEAAKRGMIPNEEGVDRAIDDLKRRNKLSHDQFIVFLLQNGLNYADYRELYKRQMVLSGLIGNEMNRRGAIGEKEAQQYFKENRGKIEDKYQALLGKLHPEPQAQDAKPQIPTHAEVYQGGELRLQQIVLKAANNNPKEKEKMVAAAKKIYEEVSKGGDFTQLAKKYSKDSSASKGGDLGYVKYKDLQPQMQKVVEHLKVGALSPPLGGKDSILILYLADAKNRQVKKVPIPEKERKQLEKRLEEARKKQLDRQSTGRENPNNPGKDTQAKKGETEPGSATKEAQDLGILSLEELKEYKQVQDKVMSIVKTTTIDERMKDWTTALKKDAIIEVRM
ncbi:MAG: peptidylprolyl isomerase [Desulfomonile tiedjei]|nr:peptidylprolyl isomerase [Desulfomonile tiedjei]